MSRQYLNDLIVPPAVISLLFLLFVLAAVIWRR